MAVAALKVPGAEEKKVTVPVGVTGVPSVVVSVTVTVIVAAWSTYTVPGLQTTSTLTVRRFTTRLSVPSPAAWTSDPP